MRNAFLIIDAQFDFCHPDGALFVPGADADVERIASLIRRFASRIDHIVVTLDTHHVLDIAHPLFWSNAAGQASLSIHAIFSCSGRSWLMDSSFRARKSTPIFN